ncbi:MAG: hypothetical protein ACRDY7_16950 [Acidimicrobiia bacterium]
MRDDWIPYGDVKLALDDEDHAWVAFEDRRSEEADLVRVVRVDLDGRSDRAPPAVDVAGGCAARRGRPSRDGACRRVRRPLEPGQYTSAEYRTACQALGITRSMASVGDSFDNKDASRRPAKAAVGADVRAGVCMHGAAELRAPRRFGGNFFLTW